MVKNITFFKIINLHTDFIPRHFDELFPKRETSNELICAATMAVILNEKPQFIDGMALNASYRLVKNYFSISLLKTFFGLIFVIKCLLIF